MVLKKVVAKNLKRPGWKRSEIKLNSQGLLLLMKLKCLMTRPQNIFSLERFTALSSLSKILFSSINSRRPWLPNLISHLFHPGPFSSWLLLFYTRGDSNNLKKLIGALQHNDMLIANTKQCGKNLSSKITKCMNAWIYVWFDL